ncbi:MAG TPA: hypothetical protein P5237_00400 [Candidatus Paceibacterota bacterium]|nr:hypothetical protein [Candidatus Paceibacterota bacterium]
MKQNDYLPSAATNQKGKKPKKKKKLLIITLICVVIIVLFGVSGTFGVIKERIQRTIDTYKTQKAIEQFYQGLDEYYQKFAEDIYGGKTPQETLDMFIEALEKGDIDLAAKYFAMDDNLSRKMWEDGLRAQAESGKIQELINIAKQFKPASKQSGVTSTYEFVIIEDNGMVEYSVEMEFNQYSGVWKIKSM